MHSRGKKITCPGARDKLNFRQDKHIFSPNVRRTSKKLNASIFFLEKDKLFSNRTSKNFDALARGQVKIFRFFYPCTDVTLSITYNVCKTHYTHVCMMYLWSSGLERSPIKLVDFISRVRIPLVFYIYIYLNYYSHVAYQRFKCLVSIV